MVRLRKFYKFLRSLPVYAFTIFLVVIYYIYSRDRKPEQLNTWMAKRQLLFNFPPEKINETLQGKLNFGLIRNIRWEVEVPQNSSIQEILDEKELEAKIRMERRRNHVQELCTEPRFSWCHIDSVLYNRVGMFYQYNATVCTIAKAGSSTWRAHLRRVNKGPPFNQSMEDDVIWRAFLSQPRETVLENVVASNKIITVRHPLTRLVSAYRNKYEGGKPMPRHRPKFEDRQRKRIAGSYWDDRFYQFWMPALFVNDKVPSDTHLKVGMKDPIDPSVRYSTEEYERLYHFLRPKLSFPQFLRFVVYQHEIGTPDAHWRPYHTTCCPCHFDYHFVTKIETLSEDLAYVFKALGIPADPDTSMNQLRSNVAASMYKDFQYYREVPPALKKDVYKWIKEDLDLFEYELPKNFLS
ncbi:carbohydrate sulfotransferase 9-like [Macrobrachium rosenbergii]|uniref:carbohydrate sulfotransferase 9-like n=1 Tax=Macrobrachium rosenbergii TaxID=79674 RepID=UPI0034D78497